MEEKKWEIRCANKDASQIAVETQNEILSLKRLQDPLLNLKANRKKKSMLVFSYLSFPLTQGQDQHTICPCTDSMTCV
jgi:hypothetical protein